RRAALPHSLPDREARPGAEHGTEERAAERPVRFLVDGLADHVDPGGLTDREGEGRGDEEDGKQPVVAAVAFAQGNGNRGDRHGDPGGEADAGSGYGLPGQL